jgi:hypothetical protein
MRPSRRKASNAAAPGQYVGSAQYHTDRIADLEAGNTAGLEDYQVRMLLAAHKIALRAIGEEHAPSPTR